MHRALTAIYPSRETAAKVRDALDTAGVPRGHIHVIPDDRSPDNWNEAIHDLHLPEDDMRTYQQAVQNGDYVVSVDVDEADRLDGLKAIMRDPGEARDIDALDAEYSRAKYIPFRHEDRPAYPENQRGTRDPHPDGTGGDVRHYTRPERIMRPWV